MTLSAFAAANQRHTVPSPLSTGEAAYHQYDPLRRRAQQASRNSGPLSEATRARRRGIQLSPTPVCGTPEWQAAWDAWAEQCGVRHNQGSFGAQMVRIANAAADEGGVWVHRVQVDPARDANGRPRHPNGLLLQLWPDRLRWRSRWDEGDAHGFEWGSDHLLDAVWFRAASSDPAEWRREPVRIDARHLFWVRVAANTDQVDPVPPNHAALAVDAMYRQWQAAELRGAQVRSNLPFVVEDPNPSLSGDGSIQFGAQAQDSEGRTLTVLRPGTVAYLRGGATAKVLNVPQGTSSHDHWLASVAAGAGFDSELIGGRLGNASFSALQMARLKAQEAAAELRQLIDLQGLLRRIVGWVKDAELLWGRDHRSASTEWNALPDRTLDQEKDARRQARMVEAGLMSKAELIRARGRDPQAVFSEIAAEDA